MDVGDEYDLENMKYWAARLKPLWINPGDDSEDISESEGEETLVVICNRVGEENGKIHLIFLLFHPGWIQ